MSYPPLSARQFRVLLGLQMTDIDTTKIRAELRTLGLSQLDVVVIGVCDALDAARAELAHVTEWWKTEQALRRDAEARLAAVRHYADRLIPGHMQTSLYVALEA